MVMEVYDRAVAKHGADNIVVMGDSAGGGFTLGLAQMLRNQGKALPAKLILLSPYLDQTAADPMQEELEETDILISIEGIRRLGSWWVREGEDPVMFPVSPLFEPVDRLPPMLAFAGSDEVLLSDSLRLKQTAAENGARIELKIYDRMQHVWMLLPIPEAKKAQAEIVNYLLAAKDKFQKYAIGFAEKQLFQIYRGNIVEPIVDSICFEPGDKRLMVAAVQRDMMDCTRGRAALSFSLKSLLHILGIYMKNRTAAIIIEPLDQFWRQRFRAIADIEVKHLHEKSSGSLEIVGDDIHMIQRVEFHISPSACGRVR